MSREMFKTNGYFEDYITGQNKRIEKFKGVLAAFDKSDTQKIAQCEEIIANLYKDLLSANYSLGASKDEIVEIFELYINSVLYCAVSNYADMIDILSLSIILDINKERLEPILQNDNFDDGLILSLKSYLAGKYELSSEGLRYPDYYSSFYLYLKEERTETEILSYVENDWYGASDEFAWYDSHNSSENIYVGYWCWIGAAVLKMKSALTVKGKYIPSEIM